MENQHRQIKGYRELSQAEIDLMNEIKQHGEASRQLLAKVREVIKDVPPVDEAHEADHPYYWLRYADSSFRTGVMYLVRAVAQPTTF